MRIHLLLLSFVICANLMSCSGESEQEKRLFEKISPGMEAEAVYKILGRPDKVTHNFDSTSIYAFFFTKNKSPLRAQDPTVVFDSLMRVKFSTYDGE